MPTKPNRKFEVAGFDQLPPGRHGERRQEAEENQAANSHLVEHDADGAFDRDDGGAFRLGGHQLRLMLVLDRLPPSPVPGRAGWPEVAYAGHQAEHVVVAMRGAIGNCRGCPDHGQGDDTGKRQAGAGGLWNSRTQSATSSMNIAPLEPMTSSSGRRGDAAAASGP